MSTPEELTLSPQWLQPIVSIIGRFWGDVRPSYTQAFQGISLPLPAWACVDFCSLIPIPCSVLGLLKKYTAQRGPEYFYSVNAETDVQVKPRLIQRQQLRSSVSQALQGWDGSWQDSAFAASACLLGFRKQA